MALIEEDSSKAERMLETDCEHTYLTKAASSAVRERTVSVRPSKYNRVIEAS
jgi:hypothetical protein